METECLLFDNSFLGRILHKQTAQVFRGKWLSILQSKIKKGRRVCFESFTTPYTFLEALGLNLSNLEEPPPLDETDSLFPFQYEELRRWALAHYGGLECLTAASLVQAAVKQERYQDDDPYSKNMFERIHSAAKDATFISSVHFALATRYAQKCVAAECDCFTDVLQMLLYCTGQHLLGQAFDAYLLVHRLYTVIHNTPEVDAVTTKRLPPINKFKSKQDLVDGELIHYTLMGYQDAEQQVVHVVTCDRPDIIKERCYMAKGAYGLMKRLLKARYPNKEFGFRFGIIHCIDKETGDYLVSVHPESMKTWSCQVSIPEVTLEMNRLVEPVGQWAREKGCIKAVYVYGSRARGDHLHESDLVLAVEIEPMANDINPITTWCHMSDSWQDELQILLPYGVHLELFDAVEGGNAIKSGMDNSAVLIYWRMKQMT